MPQGPPGGQRLLLAGLFTLAVVRGHSLEPLLSPGDFIFAVRAVRRPRAGDLVLVRFFAGHAIKPVAGFDLARDRVVFGRGGWIGPLPRSCVVARVVLAKSRRHGWLRPPWPVLSP